MTPLPPACAAAVLHVGPCFLNRSCLEAKGE